MPELNGEDWQEVDRMAAVHRLQPLLHFRQGGNQAVPAQIRQGWRDSHRLGAFAALQMSGELTATFGLLEAANYRPIALKGAWLAWHAYPDPALRPMRDIDLWLPAETVIPAYRLLLEHGYQPAGAAQLSLEQAVAIDKHLPPLVSPRGIPVELHQRLWEIDGRMDHSAPLADQEEIRARAIRIGKVTYLHPHDTLAHLIIHAVYDHRLDCGPLLLSDIAFLLAQAPADWDHLRDQAERGGWLRGAALVIELVRQHAPHLALPARPWVDTPPAAIGADLLLQDLDTRQSAGVVATLSAAGPGAFFRRVTARRSHGGAAMVSRDLQAEGGFASWARSRLVRTLRQLARREVRGQARQLAQLSQWLDQ